MKLHRFALIVPFAAAALIAGCGSSSSSSSASSASTSTPAAAAATTSSATSSAPAASAGGSTTISLSETEFKITPKTDTAKAGKVTFDVHNNGKVTHAFAIQTPGGLEQTSSISPGASATLTVAIPKAGSYTFYCPVPGHRMLGMVGTLTVT